MRLAAEILAICASTPGMLISDVLMEYGIIEDEMLPSEKLARRALSFVEWKTAMTRYEDPEFVFGEAVSLLETGWTPDDYH